MVRGFRFLPYQIWVLSHSDMTVGLVPTWSDIRAIAILGMEVPSQLPGKLSLGLRSHSDVIEGCVPTLSDVRADPFCHGEDWFLPCQIWVLSYSDAIVGLVPTWSDIRDNAILGMEVPGQLPGKLSLGLKSHSDVIEGCVPTWSDVRAEPFYHG